MDSIFLAALPVIRRIEQAGFEAFFVGGAVRDHLLGKKIHDVDIATSATPSEIKNIFSSTVDVGIEHGTILVLYKGHAFEITTYRSESDYEDYRRPESVTFIRSLVEDLKRRDFTMNAIAMDANGNIIDPFRGRESMNERIIETVGEAKERFQEDALRLMRAIRFVSQLGFSLESKTKKAIKEQAHLLQHIAVERITAEMIKLLQGNDKMKAFALAFKTGLYRYWPSIFNQSSVIERLITLDIRPLREIDMWVLTLAIEASERSIDHLKKWKLPSKKINLIMRCKELLHWRLENNWTNYQLYIAGIDAALIVERVFCTLNNVSLDGTEENVKEWHANLPLQHRSELAVSGHDLMQWVQKKPGPWMTDAFHSIENAILNGDLQNDLDEIRRWIKRCPNLSGND